MKKFIQNIRNFFASLRKIIKDPDQVPEEQYAYRMVVCQLCDRYQAGICSECWCVMEIKSRFKDMDCPLGKWLLFKE